MADGTVGIKQNAGADRLIDNETLVIGGQSVYRQRVSDPAAQALLANVVTALGGTLNVTGALTADIPTDFFDNVVTGARENQVEVHFDDVNYANYLTITNTGGGQGGRQTQAGGQVQFHSGTAATGRARGVSLDTIRYRPMHEVYAGWTAAFPDGGVANAWQRIGFFNDTDGVFIGYEGTTFGITWRNGGAVTSIPQASWDDPCDGSPGSGFTRNGAPEALDPTKSNLYRLRLGWLGAAGFVVEVMSPDLAWVPVYTMKRPNVSAAPYLANPDLPMAIDVGKTSGATDVTIATNCWAGGTTSAKARLSDPLSDRSLAETVRSVITGKTTAGGGAYVDVKVNPSGALETSALTDTQLRATPVGVADDFDTEDHTEDQAGAGAVLTFTLNPGNLVIVDVDPTDPSDTLNYRARAMCDGSDPTATLGFVCRPGSSYLPVPTSGTVKVWAPTGVTVSVQVASRV